MTAETTKADHHPLMTAAASFTLGIGVFAAFVGLWILDDVRKQQAELQRTMVTVQHSQQQQAHTLQVIAQQQRESKPVEAKYVRPEPFEMEPRLIPLGDKRRDVCIQTAWRW